MALTQSLAVCAFAFSALTWWSAPSVAPGHSIDLSLSSAQLPAEFSSECHCQCPSPAPCELGTSPVRVVNSCSWESLLLAIGLGFLLGIWSLWYYQSRQAPQAPSARIHLAIDRPRTATPSSRRRALEDS